MSNLNNLKKESIYLYFQYRQGVISKEEYIEKIKLLDEHIDSIEIESLKCYLQDYSKVSNISMFAPTSSTRVSSKTYS